MQVIITAPSLDPLRNISGVSSVTTFIIRHNLSCAYTHFEIGKPDAERRGLSRVLRNALAYWRWLRVLSRNASAIIHFNLALDNRGILRDLPLVVLARLLGRRLILHIHGGEFLTGRPMPAWARWALDVGIGSVPTIVLSDLERRSLGTRLPKAKIFVLPNCPDLHATERSDVASRRDPIVTVLFLGRISENKGLSSIYDALAQLKERAVEFRFILAGTGPDEQLYVQRFRDLLGSRFCFAGIVMGDAKTEVLCNSDVFLLPSRFEGLPMSLLEAMSFGLVPITTPVGSIPNIVNHGYNGFLVHSDAPGEIAQALERLSIDKGQMQVMGQRARRTILDNFSPAQYVTRLNEIYAYDDRPCVSCGN